MLKLGCNEIVLRIYSEHINLLEESHEIISVLSRWKYIADSANECCLVLLTLVLSAYLHKSLIRRLSQIEPIRLIQGEYAYLWKGKPSLSRHV